MASSAMVTGAPILNADQENVQAAEQPRQPPEMKPGIDLKGGQ
jgi:hypothetical protein